MNNKIRFMFFTFLVFISGFNSAIFHSKLNELSASDSLSRFYLFKMFLSYACAFLFASMAFKSLDYKNTE